MKTLGRIFEVNINGRFSGMPFKNKYVIVYENKSYFVCKEFGTDYPKIIPKRNCITLEEFYSPNRSGYAWYVIDRNHESDIKINVSSIMISKKKAEVDTLKHRINHDKHRVLDSRREADDLENKYIPEMESKLSVLEKELATITENAIKEQEAFDNFGEE